MNEIAPAIANLAAPLRKLRLPVDEWAVAIALSLRSLPLLLDEMRILRAGRRLRPRGSVRTARDNPLVDVITAMMAVTMRRAGELGEAITARGGTGQLAAYPARPGRARRARGGRGRGVSGGGGRDGHPALTSCVYDSRRTSSGPLVVAQPAPGGVAQAGRGRSIRRTAPPPPAFGSTHTASLRSAVGSTAANGLSSRCSGLKLRRERLERLLTEPGADLADVPQSRRPRGHRAAATRSVRAGHPGRVSSRRSPLPG